MAANHQRRERVQVRGFLERHGRGRLACTSDARGLQFKIDWVDPALAIDVDPQILSSAVMNLLNNAFGTTRPGGRVMLGARRTAAPAHRSGRRVRWHPRQAKAICFSRLPSGLAAIAQASASGCRWPERRSGLTVARSRFATSRVRAASSSSRFRCSRKPRRCRRRLPLDVGQFRSHFAVSDREDVDAAKMPGWPLRIFRYTHRTTARSPLTITSSVSKLAVGILREPCPPMSSNGRLPLDSSTVRRRRRVFEDGVVGHQGGQRVSVVPVERLVEPIDGCAGGQRPDRHGPPARKSRL